MKYIARTILALLLLPVIVVTLILGVLLELRKDKPDWKNAFDFPLWVVTGK